MGYITLKRRKEIQHKDTLSGYGMGLVYWGGGMTINGDM